jgi:hypothetical protein
MCLVLYFIVIDDPNLISTRTLIILEITTIKAIKYKGHRKYNHYSWKGRIEHFLGQKNAC